MSPDEILALSCTQLAAAIRERRTTALAAMETVLDGFDLRSCRDTVVVTGIGSSNCVYHAVIGFHIRNYYTVVPEDCMHGVAEHSQAFALAQFRSGAYNFNVTVARSDELLLVDAKTPLRKAAGT